jgi:hypothetical protein
VSAATLTPPTLKFEPSPIQFGPLSAPELQWDSNLSDEIPTLVIGDLHGHLDRLEALLKQEGLLDHCDHCDGTGQIWEPCTFPGTQCEYSCDHDRWIDCANCDGDGWARTAKPARVVLVGDLGHFHQNGSPTADLLTWKAGLNWADVILWGNHDRACIEEWHAHKGYLKPRPEQYQIFEEARAQGKLKLAYASHGFLITHAGLALAFRQQRVHHSVKEDPESFVEWINEVEHPNAKCTEAQLGVRDAIGSRRGGRSKVGGILWRDVNEKLYPFRQIFGHSADHKYRSVQYCGKSAHVRNKDLAYFENLSYCIDIGGPDEVPGARCLAGIWLPEERIVRVDL